MSSKKVHNLEKKKEDDDIGKIISKIHIESEELRKETNLSSRIKKHAQIKKKISATEQDLYKIRDLLDEKQNKDKNQEIISDEKYEKNMKTINKLTENNDDSLEEQIELHNKLTRLINECKSYLGSKKMELVKCEDDSELSETCNK